MAKKKKEERKNPWTEILETNSFGQISACILKASGNKLSRQTIKEWADGNFRPGSINQDHIIMAYPDVTVDDIREHYLNHREK